MPIPELAVAAEKTERGVDERVATWQGAKSRTYKLLSILLVDQKDMDPIYKEFSRALDMIPIYNPVLKHNPTRTLLFVGSRYYTLYRFYMDSTKYWV